MQHLLGAHERFLQAEPLPSQPLLEALGVVRSLGWQVLLQLLRGWSESGGRRFTCSPAFMAGGAGTQRPPSALLAQRLAQRLHTALLPLPEWAQHAACATPS